MIKCIKLLLWSCRPIKKTFEISIGVAFCILVHGCEEASTDLDDITDHGVVINEINYNSSDAFDPDDWVEIYNGNSDVMDLSSWVLKDDDDDHFFTLPSNTFLQPYQYLILCRDTVKFRALFPEVISYYGGMDFGLGGGGDYVRLFDANGSMVDMVEYDDDDPWPTLSDGSGPTLELRHPSLDNSLWENWSASIGNGTPGAINSIYDDE